MVAWAKSPLPGVRGGAAGLFIAVAAALADRLNRGASRPR